jgi:hypothetical protein
MLVLDQVARANSVALMFMVMLPAVGGSLVLFDGDPQVTVVFAATLGVAFVAATILYYITKDPRRFRVWALASIVALVALSTVAASAYFGLFSAAAIVAVLLILISALGNFRASWLTMWGVCAGGRLTVVILDVVGVLPDRGLLLTERLSTSEKVTVEILIQAVMAIALAGGRMSARSTAAKVTWLTEAVRAAAKRELEIASQIQSTMLPREIDVPGFEIAAGMVPASEVGGDYYDVRTMDDGCWIGIGDVSGHGLGAGVLMMMVQTSVASLTLDDTHRVEEVVDRVNRVLHDNIRARLRERDFVTFALLRLWRDGRLVVAGAHEPLLVHRKATGTCTRIELGGAWLGLGPSIADFTRPQCLELEPGDTVVLHTDGVTEAANAARERFGLDRLARVVERLASRPVAELHSHLEQEVLSFTARQADDVTLLVLRYHG